MICLQAALFHVFLKTTGKLEAFGHAVRRASRCSSVSTWQKLMPGLPGLLGILPQPTSPSSSCSHCPARVSTVCRCCAGRPEGCCWSSSCRDCSSVYSVPPLCWSPGGVLFEQLLPRLPECLQCAAVVLAVVLAVSSYQDCLSSWLERILRPTWSPGALVPIVLEESGGYKEHCEPGLARGV